MANNYYLLVWPAKNGGRPNSRRFANKSDAIKEGRRLAKECDIHRISYGETQDVWSLDGKGRVAAEVLDMG